MKRPRQILLLSVIGFAFSMSASAGEAEARAERVASYSPARAWPTAVRFLRIDLGYKIIERDAEAGYVLFEFEKGEKTYRGSLELVATTDYADRDAVKLIIEIVERPEYDEVWVLEKLIERLREDLGQPIDKDEKKDEPKPAEDPKNPGETGEAGKP